MTIYFITGNENKFREAKSILPNLKQIKLDLPEIQELDPKKIIEAKLEAAFAHHAGPFVVEDTSVVIESLGGLPGPFIKWFEKALGNEGIAKLVGSSKARVTTMLGFARELGNTVFFEGHIEGDIVFPRGEQDFGWGPIFQPEGRGKTFAEISPEEKLAISNRGQAFRKLKEFLALRGLTSK